MRHKFEGSSCYNKPVKLKRIIYKCTRSNSGSLHLAVICCSVACPNVCMHSSGFYHISRTILRVGTLCVTPTKGSSRARSSFERIPPCLCRFHGERKHEQCDQE
ncbi:hypothetical protein DCAR_0832783 [Daucus carota subsp. sativus]|uniref:Uncharacterized protein n=1 Tax=Daucus carota subsp. sativus TaxID=79200 RepID=A0A175YRI8_DAUCS|nr:hypothetical protein DCAR_0832783 [Daucus carota subsp. sativus]